MLRVCKSCKTEKAHEEFVKNKGCKFGITHKCKDCFNKHKKESYYPKHKERIAATTKKSVAKRRAEGKDVNKPSRDYNKRNPQYKRFYAAQRKKHIKLATPIWLTEEQKLAMKCLYDLRDKFSDLCNCDYHVDHIVPLRGENICGLNVPWNLQVLESSLNMAKRNIYS
jgi:hypothetical protein